MGRNVELERPETIYRQVTVLVTDSSATTLNLSTFGLYEGKWDPAFQPQPGVQISPGASPSYVNYTDQPFTGVGGFLTLTPMTGGQITISWSWEYGGTFWGTSSTKSTTLQVSTQPINQQTNSVTLQVTIH